MAGAKERKTDGRRSEIDEDDILLLERLVYLREHKYSRDAIEWSVECCRSRRQHDTASIWRGQMSMSVTGVVVRCLEFVANDTRECQLILERTEKNG